MTWSLLFTLATIVFLNRYFFLEPRFNLKLPVFFRHMLQYSAPCLLTAICAPIVFFQGEHIREIPLDPYFLATILTVIFALIFKKILLSLVMSLVCFYVLEFLF